MNILDGDIHLGPAGPTLRIDGRWDLPLTGRASLPAGPVKAGFRPKAVRLAGEGLPLTVGIVEPTGSETLVSAKLGDRPLQLLLRERVVISLGNTITVAVDPATIHLFDAASGRRID